MKAHALLIGTSLLAVLSVSPLAAQTAPTDPSTPAQGEARKKGGGKAEKLAAKLGLTPEQTSQIAPLVQKNRAAIRAIRDNASLTKDEKHQQISSIHAAMAQQMKTILTPDQYARWQEMKARARARAGKAQPTT